LSETLWDSLTAHCKQLHKLKSLVILLETPPDAMEKWEKERLRWCTRELSATGVLFFARRSRLPMSGVGKAILDVLNDENDNQEEEKEEEEEEAGVPSCTQFGCVGSMALARRRHLPLFLL
jgi:hypothetical protein